VCNVEENLLFSTLILGSVFNDYVVFYGDRLQADTTTKAESKATAVVASCILDGSGYDYHNTGGSVCRLCSESQYNGC